MGYQHIVVALELNPPSDKPIIQQAIKIAALYQSKLTLLHVIEQIKTYGITYGLAAGVDITAELQAEAQQQLKQVITQIGMPAEMLVEEGVASKTIARVAHARGADLIMLGSHGKHGLKRILGSTANAVMHAAECDVLAVRLQHDVAEVA